MTGRVVFVVGLTGSGKTELLTRVDQRKYAPVHDLMRDAPATGRIEDAVHFARIAARLKEGQSCAIAEIQLCDPAFRQRSSALFGRMASVDWVWFARDPEQCKRNVLERWNRIQGNQEARDRDPNHECRMVDDFAALYSPPRVDLQVYRPGVPLEIPKVLR